MSAADVEAARMRRLEIAAEVGQLVVALAERAEALAADAPREAAHIAGDVARAGVKAGIALGELLGLGDALDALAVEVGV